MIISRQIGRKEKIKPQGREFIESIILSCSCFAETQENNQHLIMEVFFKREKLEFKCKQQL